jgi:hypothetical protein
MRVLAFALLLAVSGCFGDRPLDPAPATAGPDGLRVGDWWALDVHDDVVEDRFDVTLVVTALDPLSVSVNPGAERALLLPAPPRGIVDPETWGFGFLGETFEPIQLPPVAGASWKTRLQGNDLNGTILSVEDGVARAELHGPASDIYLNYSVPQRMFLDFNNDNWVHFGLVASGRDYEGAVRFPSQYDHVINHGRLVGGTNPQASTSQGPIESVTVPTGYADIVGVSVVGSFMAPGSPGVYSECARSPRGKEFCISLNATDAPRIASSIWNDADPSGQWNLESIVVGAGVAYTQAVAVTWEEVQLPRV